jgi:hypothetical protein
MFYTCNILNMIFNPFFLAFAQIYNEQDISKMPLELGSALAIEREPVTDPEIRVQTLEAVYLITLQVK